MIKISFTKKVITCILCLALLIFGFTGFEDNKSIKAMDTSYWYYKTISNNGLLLHIFYKHERDEKKAYNASFVHVICTEISTMKTLWKNDFGGMEPNRGGYPNLFHITDKSIFGLDTTKGFCKAVDLLSGKILWKVKCINPPKDNDYYSDIIPSKSKDIVLFRFLDDMFCINATNGKIIRKTSLKEQFVHSEIVPSVLIKSSRIGEFIYFEDTKTGKQLYSITPSKDNIISSCIELSLLEAVYLDRSGYGYYRDSSSKVIKFDVKTGKTIWKSSQSIFSNITYEDNSRVYLDGIYYGNSNQSISPVSSITALNKASGKIEWQIKPTFNVYDSFFNKIDSIFLQQPEYPTVPMCPVPASVHYSNGYVFVVQTDERNENKFFSIFRLSDGKQLVKREQVYRLFDSIAINQKVFTVKFSKGDYYKCSLALLDINTGKELNTLPKVSYCDKIDQNSDLVFILETPNTEKTKSRFCALRKSDLKLAWSNTSKFNNISNIEMFDTHFILSNRNDPSVIEIYNTSTGKLVKYLAFNK